MSFGTLDSTDFQAWKMSETLPKRDFSYPVFTQKCMNYANFKTWKNKCIYNKYSIYIYLRLGKITQLRVI